MLSRLRQLLGLAPTARPESRVEAPAATPPVEAPRAEVLRYGEWAPDGAWIAERRSAASTYVDLSAGALQAIREVMPDQVSEGLAAATRVLGHEFNLLGSGPFVPVDPDRATQGEYRPIDWYLDPVRELRFPRGVPYKEWKLYEMRPGNADIKYPWELARCQHWATLGQAYRLTGDERFAQEIAHQLDDFMAGNPVGVGVNWTCTMDVGLRAVSWVIGLDLVRRSTTLDEAFWARAYAALFDHGLFIRGNLENTYEVTSNHFLSNVVGLWFLASLFETLPPGRDWAVFSRAALETEIDVQVLPDGADFESSVPYHRLVAELFIGCLRLADFKGGPLSAHYRERVRDMIGYLADVIRPDGLMPQSGDADDGRLHVFGGVGTASPQDGRHLLGPAAIIFERPEWAQMGGSAAAWEAAWWGLGVAAAPPRSAYPAVVRLYPDAGHAVVRDGGLYLLVTNSCVGTKGFGNHKHNDQLGFEYHFGGGPLVVDPGSYVYTSDPNARNLFRGTGYHNTLMIDETEQNEINPEWLFRTFEKASAEHLAFTAGDVVKYEGRHVGYTRLAEGVAHTRGFVLDRRTGRLDIDDRLDGTGRHRLAWRFHFAPGVAARRDGSAVALTAPWARVRLEWPASLTAHVAPSWYSPSYGARVASQCLTLSAEHEVAASAEWRFALVPEVTA